MSHLATGSFSVPVSASGFPLAPYFGLACTLLKLSFVVNIALALFNLIPIPPLDGSWVLEHLFPRSLGPLYAALRPYGFLIFVVAMYSDLFNYLSRPVNYVFAAGMTLLAATTGW
jgi:Zn-dependent protease